MYSSLAQKAIAEALAGAWRKAVNTNLQILKSNPNDIDSLNRLARAYAELDQIRKAKTTAQKVLKIDSVNPIAIKALEKWKALKKKEDKPSPTCSSSPESFLEESGKTKIAPLIHIGDKAVLASLDSGDEVGLLTHPHRVSIVTKDGKYIGRLPDDLAARLRRFIKLGNDYQVLIKSIEEGEVKVFIRGSAVTFPPEKIDYISFTPPELVHRETPEIDLPED